MAARIQRSEGGVALPAELRVQLEPRLGADLSGVRIQRASELAPDLDARAFTYGNRIHFAPGEYDPSSADGVRLIAHEVTHSIQQGAVPALHGTDAAPAGAPAVNRVIQREYDTLAAMGKARVDVAAENTYALKVKELEERMGPAISREPAAHEIIDQLLAILRRLVLAWSFATGTPQDVALPRELSFSGSERYYGAFHKTAETINEVFADTSLPLRTKFHLIYNAVRNNNLSKYLEVAALELEQVLKTGAATPQAVNVSTKPLRGGDWSGATREIAQPGFAKASGLKPILEADSGARQKSFADIAEKRKWNMATGAKEPVFAADEFSPVMGLSSAVNAAGGSRIGGQNVGLTLDEQRTLKGRDVPDLAPHELAQLGQTESVKGRAATLANPATRATSTTKIEWEQGREYYSVAVNSVVDKAAAKVRARLEAGISGSTDLMLHAAQNLGLTMEQQRKLRLALVGWMLSNHDHSFYEIMVASQSYGLPFVKDDAEPGREYEAPENFWPMDVAKIGQLLPEKKFPRHFLSPAYRNQLAAGLVDKGKSAGNLRTSLQVLNVPTAVLDRMSEHDLAQIDALRAVVGTKGAKLRPRNVTDPEAAIAATKHNEIMLRRLREHPAYKDLARTHPAHVDAILNGLLASGVAMEVVPTYRNPEIRQRADDLIAAGVPEVHVTVLSERGVLDLTRFSLNVAAETFAGGDPARLANDAAMSRLWLDPLFVELCRTYGEVWGRRVLPALVAHHHGAVVPFGPGVEPAVRADEQIIEIEKIAQLERTTGRWYSWGPLPYQQGFANASSIFHHARGAAYSPQGYGLYISDKSKGSQGYGKDPGCGLAVVDLVNVPTIKRRSNVQRTRLAALTWKGNPMVVDNLYQDELYAELLLMYQGEYGEFIWARLTTSRGVRVTTDLTRLDARDVRLAYDGVTNAEARNNLKIQATSQGVDTSAWPTP